MKVVLFCGGLGMRLREYSESTPKPLVPIGERPILWHIMKYYAHYGHKDFILCLGYRGEAIKQFFLDYNEALANDFIRCLDDLPQDGRLRASLVRFGSCHHRNAAAGFARLSMTCVRVVGISSSESSLTS